MVRKKKKREAEQTPWCYYCDRIFADESTLIQHQKAKHFKVGPPTPCTSITFTFVFYHFKRQDRNRVLIFLVWT